MGEPILSKISTALVAVASAANVLGQVFDDKVVNFKDLGVIIANLGKFSGLALIDLAGVVNEAGKLNEAARAQAVAAFKAEFDVEDVTEAFIEEAVDAALSALLAFNKAKGAFDKLKPKLLKSA